MATTGGAAYPKWLLDSKSELTRTDEWKVLTEELYQAIQQQLTESRVSRFTELSDAEKQLFLERAAKAIQEGETLQNFKQLASKSLDQHLSSHANQQLLTSAPTGSKSELILDHAREGALGLLKRWPGNKAKLHQFFNQALPDRLRQITWRLFLRSPKVRSLYLEQLKSDPNNVMSILDLEIIQTSEALLLREPTFEELANNTDILHAMKAVLSYHHVCKKTKSSLIDTDYMLVIPFLVNVLSTTRPEQLVLETTLSVLIEEFLTFMTNRPVYMRESYVQGFQESMEVFAGQIVEILQEKDEPLVQHMERIFKRRFTGLSTMVQGIKPLVRPMSRCLFVGYLSLDAVMFVWDQYILGLDRPDYDVIPSLAAIVLMLLRKYLLQCQSLPEMENALKRNANKLNKDQLMYEIGRNFYQTLYGQLNNGQDGMPVLDPTQVAMPWEYWHKEMLPQRLNKAQNRRQEREDREQDRDKQNQRLKDEENDQVKQEKFKEEDKAKLKKAEQNAKEEQLKLQSLLEQENKKRLESERAAQKEIEQLKQQLEKLKQSKQAPVASSAPAPPARSEQKPSESRPASKTSTPADKEVSLAPRQLNDPTAAKAMMTDIMKEFMHGIKAVHGD
ncbi:uncharacterized protein LOC117289929 isoform X2 [Asterias rubens]|uniref:uncharacterized protein LOC117289929 isoform X2 n=1 Tax=Asterias rubens TaxID=7604 RepID=UPI001454EC11|nr:uncharacterized protein LOC117289929 isoform X2 [Asterias rubens]